jgi:hypothetical protein
VTRNNINPILHNVEIVRILAYIALKTDKRIVKSSLTLPDDLLEGLHCPLASVLPYTIFSEV